MHNGWSGIRLSGIGDLNDIWGSSGTNVFAVGDDGTILYFNGDSWESMESGVGADLNGVWGSSASDVWTVGDYGTALHYDGGDEKSEEAKG